MSEPNSHTNLLLKRCGDYIDLAETAQSRLLNAVMLGNAGGVVATVGLVAGAFARDQPLPSVAAITFGCFLFGLVGSFLTLFISFLIRTSYAKWAAETTDRFGTQEPISEEVAKSALKDLVEFARTQTTGRAKRLQQVARALALVGLAVGTALGSGLVLVLAL